METEGVDFKGALEHLADRYKVTLELEDEDPQAAEQRKRRERLLELLERTATYYVRQLWESGEAAKAREYLAGRGLQEATLREFRVGYAPSAWDTVLNASRRAGFGNRELYDAGLAQRSQSSGRIYDRFRSQIIFPLADPRGRVRGFAGRTMGGDAATVARSTSTAPRASCFTRAARCSPPTSRARRRRRRRASSRPRATPTSSRCTRSGVRNAVGIMGTALTEDQIGELARLAPEVKLALDADSAGKEAMLRAARVAAGRKPPLRLRVVGLPPGDDPADLVQREGGEAIGRLVDGAVPFARFRILRRLELGDLGSAEGRDRVLDELRDDFSLLEPSAEREELARIAASRLDLSPELLESLLARAPARGDRPAPTERRRRAARRAAVAAARPPRPTERSFLALCIALPELGEPALRRARSRGRPDVRRGASRGDPPADPPALAHRGARRALRRRARRADPRARRAGRRDGLHLTSRLRDRAPAARARAGRPRDRRGPCTGRGDRQLAARRSGLRARLDELMEQV